MKKYETVMAWVRSSIDNGRLEPGDKLPSESELMAQFDVSRNSVRQALNELTKEGLVETRHGIGTFCKKRNFGKTMIVGLVCLRMASYIFPRIIQGCNRVMQKNGYKLLMNESWYDLTEERNVLLALRQMRVDGIILIPVQADGGASNAELVKQIQDDGIAVVLLDNEYPQYRLSSVVLDDVTAGATAAEYLWDEGHRQIGVLYSSNYRPKILRKNGVVEFVRGRGGVVRDEWIIGIDGQTSPLHTYGQIRALFKQRLNLPTAMVCSSDDEALMFIYQARHHGLRVPRDISVVSFDNSDFSKFSQPRLTSMDHPSDYMGEIAATMLLDRLQRRERPGHMRTVIQSELIRRDSVARLAT